MIYSFSEYKCKNLKAKKIQNKVICEKTKPTAETVGFCEKISDSGKSEDEQLDTFILTGEPNLYKQMRQSVSQQGYIKIPRSLIESEQWRDLSIYRQKLFLYILQRVQFTEKREKHNGIEFIVMPGQLCISLRSLLEDYNSNIKYKDEKIDLSFLQRAVSRFLAAKWIDTQTDTGITIITVTQSDLYEHFKNLNDTPNDTPNDTAAIQRKERKERKESVRLKETNKEKEKDSSIDDSFLLNEISKENIDILNTFCIEKNLEIKEKTIIIWLKKYESEYIGMHIAMLIDEIEKKTLKKEKIDNHEAWMEKALKNDFAKMKKNEEKNFQFTNEYKKSKNWNELKILKKYATDTSTGEQFKYSLRCETYREILVNEERKRHIRNQS